MSDPADEVMHMIFARWRSQTLYAGVELGVFELLSEGARPATDVATELDLDPDNTYRLLRALASLGLLEERPDRTFAINERGEHLIREHPMSLRGIARLVEGEEQYAIWPHLPELVESGEEDAFEKVHGASLFQYVQENPEHAEVFDEGMTSHSTVETRDVLEALADYRFDGPGHLCDVGGGGGHLLSHLLEDRPRLTGEILELPQVAEKAGEVPERLGVDDRIAFTPGDMFEAVPEADGYFLKHILHDWSDGECVEILESVAEAAGTGTPVMVAEYVVPGPNGGQFAKLFDLHMLLCTGGRERTVEEYGELFDRAGIELVDHHQADGRLMSVVEGRVT
jgi:predicted transcriptional regulator